MAVHTEGFFTKHVIVICGIRPKKSDFEAFSCRSAPCRVGRFSTGGGGCWREKVKSHSVSR